MKAINLSVSKFGDQLLISNRFRLKDIVDSNFYLLCFSIELRFTRGYDSEQFLSCAVGIII